MPTSLRAALETPARLIFDGDPEISSGVITAPGAWKPPPGASPEELESARRYVRAYSLACEPAPDSVVLEWLMRLIGGIPHGMSGTVLEMRLEALVEAAEDLPGFLWSRENRKAAIPHFRNVPSSLELRAWADRVAGEERERVRRLMAIIDLGAKPAAPCPAAPQPRAWSKEIAEEHGLRLQAERREELLELGRIMRERDAQAAAAKRESTDAAPGNPLAKAAAALQARRPMPTPGEAARAQAEAGGFDPGFDPDAVPAEPAEVDG